MKYRILDHYFKNLIEFDCSLVSVSFRSVQSSHLAFHVGGCHVIELLLANCLVNAEKYSNLTLNGPLYLPSLPYVIQECKEPN